MSEILEVWSKLVTFFWPFFRDMLKELEKVSLTYPCLFVFNREIVPQALLNDNVTFLNSCLRFQRSKSLMATDQLHLSFSHWQVRWILNESAGESFDFTWNFQSLRIQQMVHSTRWTFRRFLWLRRISNYVLFPAKPQNVPVVSIFQSYVSLFIVSGFFL